MQKACDLPFSNHDFKSVLADMKEGKLQAFWAEDDSAIILTEICVSPRRRFLNIFMAAGRLESVFALTPKVVKFARDNGLSQTTAQIRAGWGPSLKKKGWKKLSEIWTFPEQHWDD